MMLCNPGLPRFTADAIFYKSVNLLHCKVFLMVLVHPGRSPRQVSVYVDKRA